MSKKKSEKKPKKTATRAVATTRRRGRPRKTLTPEQLEMVGILAGVLSVEQLAARLGIGITTFYSMMERDPRITEIYQKGRAQVIEKVSESLLAKALGGDTASMIFFLKTQARWKETTGIDHTSSDGTMAPGAIKVPEKIEIVHVKPGDANKAT
jgi:DNA-binding CsgD family transcriptional regulator